jgi:hypothetical protein
VKKDVKHGSPSLPLLQTPKQLFILETSHEKFEEKLVPQQQQQQLELELEVNFWGQRGFGVEVSKGPIFVINKAWHLFIIFIIPTHSYL